MPNQPATSYIVAALQGVNITTSSGEVQFFRHKSTITAAQINNAAIEASWLKNGTIRLAPPQRESTDGTEQETTDGTGQETTDGTGQETTDAPEQESTEDSTDEESPTPAGKHNRKGRFGAGKRGAPPASPKGAD